MAFARRRARCWRSAPGATGEGERRSESAKGESERRKRKSRGSSGAEISDRDVRLPDERPRLRAHGGPARTGRLRGDRRRRATPTSSSSTPAASASAPRTSSTRGSASCAQLAAEHGPRSDRRRRRLRRAAGRRGDPQALARRRRRRRRHAGDPPPADARRAGRSADARGRLIDLDPYDDVTFPLGRDAAQRSGQGLRHDHRRLQRVLQLLRRAVHARPRADAAEGRHPGRGPRGGRHAATAKSSCSDRSSITTQAPDDPACDFAGLLEAVHDVDGHRADPLRQPASAARLAAVPRGDARPAEGLPAPAPAGAVGLDARARGDAAALHARELPRSGRRGSASRCRTSRSRPI